MVKFNHILAIFVWAAAGVALARVSEPWYGMMILVPFILGPHMVSHVLCFFLKSKGSGTVLCIGILAYLAWFFFIYIDVFFLNPDPQSPIALLFVGLLSLPVMIPIWLISAAKEQADRMKRKR
jgi:hypothetical protein